MIFLILINKEKISSHQIIKLLCIIVLRVKKGNSKFGCCENEKTEERRKEKCKLFIFVYIEPTMLCDVVS